MFTDLDITHMKRAGMDLSSRDSVEKNAAAIYKTVSEGTMPPPGDGESRWTTEMCESFKQWMTQGFPP
jgi:hypothetical protein